MKTNAENRAIATCRELEAMSALIRKIYETNLWPKSGLPLLEEAYWKFYPPTGKDE